MTGEASSTGAFVFTDIESSTRLWERFPEHMTDSLARHDEILRDAVRTAGGTVVKTTGDGLMAVFDDAGAALGAALAAQRRLAATEWGSTGELRVRMGIHWGPAQVRDDDYFGPTVNRTARIMAAGHGGQVLVSAGAASQAAGHLPPGTELRDMGEHRLRDLASPERLFQLVAADLPDQFPRLSTLNLIANNLPTQTTAFLGRSDEVRGLRALLGDPANRLITLTGPGGTGKTRLALQAAAEESDRYSDGVYLVDLSPDTDVDAAVARIVRAVAAARTSAEDPAAALQQAIGGRRVLLLLDNCEQVGALGPAVAGALRTCPRLTVLATSRQPLHVRGERLVPVLPLSLPEAGATAAEALQSEAVHLFLDRAQAAGAELVVAEDNVSDVVAVCRRLDGLPLALELAAARMRLFSVAELHRRLGAKLLRGGARDLPDRQRTLTGAIDWSYGLLDAQEKGLFALFSVFADADIESVESVAHDSGVADGGDVVEVMESLLEKSLLRPVPGSPDRSRFGMLQVIRDYARDLLERRPDAAKVRSAHAAHFAGRVGEAGALLAGQRRDQGLAALEWDLQNEWEAWNHFVGLRDSDRLMLMVEPLRALHQSRGWYRGLVHLSRDLLAVLGELPKTPQLVAQQMNIQTGLARALMALDGYTEEVETAFDRALLLAQSSDGEEHVLQRAAALRNLCGLHQMRMEFPQALARGRELLELAQRQQDPFMLMDAHMVVGALVAMGGAPDEGLAHLDTAVALFHPDETTTAGRSLAAHPGIAALTSSALILWLRGFPDRARARAQRADDDSSRLGHPFSRAFALFHAAFLDLLLLDVPAMSRRADELFGIASANDYGIWRALAMLLQGTAAVFGGKAAEGVERTREAMTLYHDTSGPPIFWSSVLMIRSTVLLFAGDGPEARRLAAEALSTAPPGSMDRAQALLNRADVELGLGGDVGDVRAACREALATSRSLGTRMDELRAATRLLRIAEDDWQRSEAARTLRAVFDEFTEGFDTPDLLAAAAELRNAEGS